MKTLVCALVASFLLATIGSATTKPPRNRDEERAAKAEFKKQGGERHKWRKGQPLPESLADAGLREDARLVWAGMYLDGGTVGVLFRDSAGNFLAVCSGPGLQRKHDPQQIDAERNSRLFIGDIHYREPAVEMIPPGSKTDAWMRKLLEEQLKLSGRENLVAPILGAI